MHAVYACLTQQHQLPLVAVAGVICLLASITAFNLMHRAFAARRRARLVWLLTAAIATGSGIWSTHFVAMLAFRPGIPAGYEVGLTGLSAVIALAVTGLGLALGLYGPRGSKLYLGGGIVGLGVSAMHYTGMAALRLPAITTYEPELVLASVLFGVTFGAAALPAAFRQGSPGDRLIGAVLLTLGICTMHFTAMGALQVVASPLVPLPGDHLLPPEWLAAGVALTTLVLLAFSLTGAVLDQHLARRTEQEADRLHSLVNATFEGIAIHAGGRMLDANLAFARLLGRELDQIIGRPVLEFAAPESRELAQRHIRANHDQPYEAELLRGDGSRVPVEILGRAMEYQGASVRVAAIRDISERKRNEERIRHMAHHDALTGLPNRVLFRDRLEQALARARRSGETVGVLCLDLDRFKEINDMRGHPVGDQLLAQVASRLLAGVRETDTVARLGGDEFAIVQPGLHQPHDCAALAERLIAAIAEPFEVAGQATVVGLSVGIALFPGDGTDPDTLLKNADTALYRAKADGRGTFRMFEAGMDLQLQRRRALEYDLRQALATDQLDVHYQPQAEARTGHVVGFEALVRWCHPQRGMVPPAEFIPLAEETGLILPLGTRVLRLACAEAAGWPRHLRVSVNVSPAQFGRSDLPGLVADVLKETGLAAQQLELEITEGVLVKDSEQALEVLRRLKGLGVRIAMDDFGTGYSSLSYLQRFPFDKIKIDQSFIRSLEADDDAAAIVRAVIGLGRSLRMPVVAEGVETDEQLALLRREHCDEIQGYLIGRPLPIDAYREIVGARTQSEPQDPPPALAGAA